MGQRIDISSLPYGAQAGGPDCAPIYQRAVDDLIASGAPGVIYTPANSQPYYLFNPVLCDGNRISFSGDGDSSTIQSVYSWPALTFGLKRPSLSSAHWVDAFGVLDSSVVSSTGQKWGLRTSNDSHVSLAASPFAFGANDGAFWTRHRALTIDLALVNYAGTWNPPQQIGGLMEYQQPAPFYLSVDWGPIFNLVFRLSDGITRTASIPAPTGTGLIRLCWQIDLAAGKIIGSVNGVQQTVMGAMFPAGLSFVTNYTAPFNLGSLSQGATAWQDLFGGAVDYGFFGCKLSNAALYTDVGSGATQTRLDGAPSDDNHRYFLTESACMASLPLSNSSDPISAVRWDAGAEGGGGHGNGWLMSATSGNNGNSIVGNAVRNLVVKCGGNYGQAVSTGLVLDFDFDDARFYGGAHSVGSLNMGANYPVRLTNCELSNGHDSCFYSYTGTVWARGTVLKYPGRSALRFWASSARFADTFTTDSPYTEAVVRMHSGENGGVFAFDGWWSDFESVAPSKAYFWADLYPVVPSTRLAIRDAVLGILGPNTSGVLLTDPPSGNSGCNPSKAYIQNVPNSPSVQIQSSLWSVGTL